MQQALGQSGTVICIDCLTRTARIDVSDIRRDIHGMFGQPVQALILLT